MKDYTLSRNPIELSQALLEVFSDDAAAVMGWPDDRKLKSSMTLFALAKPECEIFQKVLDKFLRGEKDQKTIEILKKISLEPCGKAKPHDSGLFLLSSYFAILPFQFAHPLLCIGFF